MGRRLKGRTRLLRGLVLEVGVEGDCWYGRLGDREWVAAEMERRLGVSGEWMLGLVVACRWIPFLLDESRRCRYLSV